MQSIDELITIRKHIDKIDGQIINLLAKRINLIKKIGQVKKSNGLAIKDRKRETQILEGKQRQAKALNLSSVFIKKIWRLIFKEAYAAQGKKSAVDKIS